MERRVAARLVHPGLNEWRSAAGRGAIHYADVKGRRITAGLPRAEPADLRALYAEFAADCRRSALEPLHFGITGAALELLPAASSRARWHIGDLPIFNLSRWIDEEDLPRGIRMQTRRARNHDVTVAHWPSPPRDSSARDALRDARNAWLRAKHLPPLRFMTTPFLFEPWPDEGVFVAAHEGRIIGFLTASRVLFGDVFRVDAVARVPDAPNGTAELLVREAFRHAASRGVEQATLGLAPLSRRDEKGGKTVDRGWQDAVSWLARRIGGPLYSFAGLEAFKAKFAPDAWVPLYCVAPGPRFTLRDVLAVARAFAGGSMRRYAYGFVAWRLNRARTRRGRLIPSANRP